MYMLWECVCVCVCERLTSLCDASALPSHARVSQEPPLPLHPHLTLQVMLLWDLKELERDREREREKERERERDINLISPFRTFQWNSVWFHGLFSPRDRLKGVKTHTRWSYTGSSNVLHSKCVRCPLDCALLLMPFIPSSARTELYTLTLHLSLFITEVNIK